VAAWQARAGACGPRSTAIRAGDRVLCVVPGEEFPNEAGTARGERTRNRFKAAASKGRISRCGRDRPCSQSFTKRGF